MAKKAFFFTIDTIVAAAITAILVLYIFAVLSAIDKTAGARVSLSRYEYDLLVSAEKNGTLQNVVESGNTAYLNGFKAITRTNMCGYLVIYKDFAENPTHSPTAATLWNCRCPSLSDLVVLDRSFVAVNRATGKLDSYVAEFGGCYK